MKSLKIKPALQSNIMNLLNTKGLQAFIVNNLELDLNNYVETISSLSSEEVSLKDKLNLVLSMVINEKNEYKENLNNFIYDYIFNYELNNQIIYNFNELDINEIKRIETNIKNYIENEANINLENSNFFDIDKLEDSFYIVKNYEGKIEILSRFFVNNHKAEKSSKAVFIGYELDFNNNIVSFKYNESRVIESYKQDQDVAKNFSQLREFFLGRLNKITKKLIVLEVEDDEIDSEYYEKFIFELFKNDYKHKCEQFANEIDYKLDETVLEAVNTLEFQNTHEKKAKNLIKHLKYYDIALIKSELDYTDFVFSFQFKDHNVTSSRTAAKKHKPIYSSEIYWNLVQVALDKKKITEIGILFNVVENNKIYNQEVLLTSKNGYFMMKFYQYELAKSSGISNLQYKFEARRIVDEHIKNKLKNFVSR